MVTQIRWICYSASILLSRKPLSQDFQEVDQPEIKELLPIKRRSDITNICEKLRKHYIFEQLLPKGYIASIAKKVDLPPLPSTPNNLKSELQLLFPINENIENLG